MHKRLLKPGSKLTTAIEGFGAASNRYRSPMDRCPLLSKRIPLTALDFKRLKFVLLAS
jgi:hypothetical protein